MTAAFLFCAALMLVAALGLVLIPLLRGRAHDPSADAKRKLRLLDQARDEGLLAPGEYDEKRAALARLMLDAVDRPATRSRTAFVCALIVALVLPAAAILLYRHVGNPGALDPRVVDAENAVQAPSDHTQDMDAAIAKLAEKLQQNPDDAEGWALLGRAYEATSRFEPARDALKRAHELAPDDAEVTVAYAEALALSGESHRIEGEPLALIEGVLKTHPDQERGLWLLGIARYQQHNYDDAIKI
ncbi:MAG TPA: c-type cytochrome biogenesis protein CcmI, partial [Rudaea sp.]